MSFSREASVESYERQSSVILIGQYSYTFAATWDSLWSGKNLLSGCTAYLEYITTASRLSCDDTIASEYVYG